MQSSCCIKYYNIKISVFSSTHGIKYYCRRITSLSLLYNFNSCSFSPFFNLLYRSCPECISSSYYNLFPFIFKLICYLSYGSCLSNSIYSHNKNNIKFSILYLYSGTFIRGIVTYKFFLQQFLQLIIHSFRCFQFLFAHLFFQLFYKLHSHVHSYIRLD